MPIRSGPRIASELHAALGRGVRAWRAARPFRGAPDKTNHSAHAPLAVAAGIATGAWGCTGTDQGQPPKTPGLESPAPRTRIGLGAHCLLCVRQDPHARGLVVAGIQLLDVNMRFTRHALLEFMHC